MAKSSTTLKKGDNLPARGKAFKTKLLEAVEKGALLTIAEGQSYEEAYLSHIATRAFDKKDKGSAILLKEIFGKSYPSMKPTYPAVEFDFDPETSPANQVGQILDAASKGFLPPDIARTFIDAIKSAVDIESATDLKNRIEAIEELLNGKSG